LYTASKETSATAKVRRKQEMKRSQKDRGQKTKPPTFGRTKTERREIPCGNGHGGRLESKASSRLKWGVGGGRGRGESANHKTIRGGKKGSGQREGLRIGAGKITKGGGTKTGEPQNNFWGVREKSDLGRSDQEARKKRKGKRTGAKKAGRSAKT